MQPLAMMIWSPMFHVCKASMIDSTRPNTKYNVKGLNELARGCSFGAAICGFSHGWMQQHETSAR